MTDLVTCPRFNHGEARKAAELYAATFPDSRVYKVTVASAESPSCREGNESASFLVITDDQEETDHYWNAIVGNGGEESACAWCKDRSGHSWQVAPRPLLELTTVPTGMRRSGPSRQCTRWERSTSRLSGRRQRL